jgi:drug/metabolite transporter (DMT)-like permease
MMAMILNKDLYKITIKGVDRT